MLKETFAERLKTAMDLQGKKQVDLIRIASLQGVKLGKSHISQYVNGKTLPREDILHFLAETLQVKEEWLVLGRKLTIRQKFPEASYDRLLIQDFRLTQESISDEPWLRRFHRP